MAKLKNALFTSVLIFLSASRILGDGISNRLNVATQDGTVSNWPYKLKVTNGSLTDNSDGTMSLGTGAGLPLPPGDTNYIQNRATLQSGATFYVSSGTIINQLTLGSGSESAPAIAIGQGNTGFYNSGSGQLTMSANGTRRLDLLANGFASSQNNDSSGMFFSGQDTEINSNNGLVKFRNGVNGNTPMQIDVMAQSVTVGGQLGLNVTFGATVATFTVTGSTVILNGVTSSYPAAACLQNQVLVSNGGTAPQLWSCQGQSGAGGGVVGYSGSAVSLTSTIYFPIVGGLAPSGTESAVDSPSPSGATLANFYAQLSQAVGVGNSVAFTWRKNGVNQSLTCTISGSGSDSCNDTSHSFTVSQGDTVTIQAVPSGIIGVTPNVIMITQFGTTGSNGTVNNGTANQMAYYAAGGTAVSGTSNLTSVGNSIVVNSSASFTQGIYFGTNTVTSNYTATSTDTVIFCDASGGARTVTLSTASFTGQNVEVFKIDVSANACIVSAANTNLIVSTGIFALYGQGAKIALIADGGSKWWAKEWDVTPPYIGTTSGGGTSQAVATSSNIYCNWTNVTVPVRVSAIRYGVGGTSNGNADVAIIDQNCNRLASAGTFALPATGAATTNLTSAVNLTPGQYGICIQVSNVTATLISSNNGATGSFFNTATTMGIPATLTCPGTASTREYGLAGIIAGGITQ